MIPLILGLPQLVISSYGKDSSRRPVGYNLEQGISKGIDWLNCLSSIRPALALPTYLPPPVLTSTNLGFGFGSVPLMLCEEEACVTISFCNDPVNRPSSQSSFGLPHISPFPPTHCHGDDSRVTTTPCTASGPQDLPAQQSR